MSDDFFSPLSDQGQPPTYKFFNGQEWVVSASGQTVPVYSPVDKSRVGNIQVVTSGEIDAAFTLAGRVQPGWEATPLNQRIKIVKLAADWIRHYEEYLTTLLAREIGKTMDEAKSEIKRTADLTDYFADEVVSLRGEELDSDNFPGYDKGRIALVERVAYGVVVAIAPFNYPVNLSASKIVPALLMGNAVIFKPPTQGGISGLHLTRIFEKAGLPAGVICCLTGGGSDVGNYIISHQGADMVAFTGSSQTGAAIAGQAKMKPLLFECGGNNPAMVLPDADMNLTAREIVKGSFSYAGQRCTAIKYVLATSGVLRQLTPILLKTMEELIHMGDPRSPETKLVGPVISEQAANSIEQAINGAVGEGAKVLIGGKRDKAYIQPTVLTGVTAAMKIVATEVFGPVLSLVAVTSTDEAIDLVNHSAFGLQASIFTQDEGTGLVLARRLNVGTVQINGSPQRGPDHFPFLGVRTSGVGVQGVRYSLESMSRLRPIVINKPA